MGFASVSKTAGLRNRLGVGISILRQEFKPFLFWKINMNMYICKDNSDYPESLTKGKAYVLYEKIGYVDYLSLIEDDNGNTRLYPSAIFVQDK